MSTTKFALSTAALSSFDRAVDSGAASFAVEEAWRGIDPSQMATQTREGDRLLFTSKLALGAQVCSGNVELGRQMRYDLVGQFMELRRYDQAVAQIDTLMGELPKTDFGSERFTEQKMQALLTRYSLIAMRAHCRAARAKERYGDSERTDEAFDTTRALLGGIVQEGVVQMEALCKIADDHSYDEETRERARGRTFEFMRFMYHIVEWYQLPDPSEMYVRMASDREDRPHNKDAFPRRSFDIMIRRADVVELEQLKAGGEADDYNYAKPIHVVVPKTPFVNLSRQPKQLLYSFVTLVNPGSTFKQAQAAKAELDKLIGDPNSAQAN